MLLRETWERLVSELVVLFLAVLWGMLRVGSVVVRRLEKNGVLIIRIRGKEVVHVALKKDGLEKHHEQRVKDAIQAIKGSDTPKTGNLT